MTYKSYVGLKDLNELSPDRFVGFLKALRDGGYNGSAKVVGDIGYDGVRITDQMVMHGQSEADAKLALEVAKKYFAENVGFTDLGKDEIVDGEEFSYSEIVARRIAKAVDPEKFAETEKRRLERLADARRQRQEAAAKAAAVKGVPAAPTPVAGGAGAGTPTGPQVVLESTPPDNGTSGKETYTGADYFPGSHDFGGIPGASTETTTDSVENAPGATTTDNGGPDKPPPAGSGLGGPELVDFDSLELVGQIDPATGQLVESEIAFDPITGEEIVYPSAQEVLLRNPKFTAFMQTLPGLKEAAANFTSPEGKKWTLDAMRLFSDRMRALDGLKNIYREEIARQFDIALDKTDFANLEAYLDKLAAENPDKLREFLAKTKAFQSNRIEVLRLEGQIDSFTSKYSSRETMVSVLDKQKLEAANAAAKVAERDTKLGPLNEKGEYVQGMIDSEEEKKNARKAAGFFGGLKMSFIEGATKGWQAVRGGGEEPVESPYKNGVRQEWAPQVKEWNENRVARINAAYQPAAAALEQAQANIKALEDGIKNLDDLNAAKEKLSAGVLNARNSLFGEIVAFKGVAAEAALQLSKDFTEAQVEEIATTAVEASVAGRSLTEVMSEKARVRKLLSETMFPPDWIVKLQKGLTNDTERAFGVRLIKERMAAIDKAYATEANPKVKNDLFARKLLLVKAIEELSKKVAPAPAPKPATPEATPPVTPTPPAEAAPAAPKAETPPPVPAADVEAPQVERAPGRVPTLGEASRDYMNMWKERLKTTKSVGGKVLKITVLTSFSGAAAAGGAPIAAAVLSYFAVREIMKARDARKARLAQQNT